MLISKEKSILVDNNSFFLSFTENIQRVKTLHPEVVEAFQLDIDVKLAQENSVSLFFLEAARGILNTSYIPISIIIHEGFIYITSVVDGVTFLSFEAPVSEISFEKTLLEDLQIIHNSSHYLVFGYKSNIEMTPVTKAGLCAENQKLGVKADLVIKTFNKIVEKYKSTDFLLETLEKGHYPQDYIDILDLGDDFEIYSNFIDKKIAKREISIQYPNIFNPLGAQEASLMELEKILKEFEFTEFSVVDVTRSSKENLNSGDYIFEITKEGNIKMILNPLVTIFDRYGNSYQVFDKNKYQKSKVSFIEIKNEEIYDFQLFGSEMISNKVQSLDNSELAGTIDSPKLFGTAIRELFLGTAYSNLKGMSGMLSQINQTIKSNKLTIETITQIEDTRVVQVILNDQSDLEFKGISIYYEFNRKLGSVKNKKTETKKNDMNVPELDVAAKMKEYKELLDSNIIDEDEFKSIKKKLLGL